MTISYLIKNRERPTVPSKRWLVVWAKRMLTFPSLVMILWATWYCKARGGKVGILSIIEGTKIFGNISNLEIGNETFVAKTVNFALHDQIVIGSRVVINSGVQLLTASHDLKDPRWRMCARPIVIDDYAWIATNATILPGVRIGKGAVVGAGAVVRCDIPDFSLAIGNPAIVKEKIRSTNLCYMPNRYCSSFEAWLGREGI